MDLMAARRLQEEQLMQSTAQIQHNYRFSDYPLQWGWVAERKKEEEEKEEKESSSDCITKEHMFAKVVTPSDVGKLNRLVIPKQHAEKYFPLDSSSNEKGLLLNFEDRGGKPWRFRYSYWNSSQSYVMTKGWSRFVKEKKLDPGDTVSFHRAVGDLSNARLYIDWRRRRDAAVALPPNFHLHRSLPWLPFLFRHPPPPPPPSFHWDDRLLSGAGHHLHLGSAADSMYYIRPQTAAQVVGGGGSMAVGNELGRVPVARTMASVVAPKRLRLFGVDVECPLSEEDECVASAEGSSSLLQRQKGKSNLYGYNLDLGI